MQYYVRRREDFRGKRVVIAGGGDSAVDWALALNGIAASIAVVHRRPKFRAAPEMAARLDEAARRGRDRARHPLPAAWAGRRGRAADRRSRSRRCTASMQTLAADILLPFFGLSMDLGPIADWGLALERHHLPVTPATCETNLPGVFAIGDVATYPGKLKLILQGFAEARDGRPCHPSASCTRALPCISSIRRARACRAEPPAQSPA